jgi:flotillin
MLSQSLKSSIRTNTNAIISRSITTLTSSHTSCLNDKHKTTRKPSYVQKRDLSSLSLLSPEALGLTALAATGAAATSIWLMMNRYKIALSNQYVVKTGLFIEGATLHKKTFQWPFQTATYIGMEPKPYHHVIDKAMSKEKIAFKMPVAFTIGPLDKPEALQNMVNTILGVDVKTFDDLVIVAVAGACRRQAGTLELEHIFSDRTKFRDQVIDIINKELFPFGLHILTMNIDELEDMEGNEYFKYLRKRALEGAVNTAKVAVAEKVREGDIGQKLHQSETRKEVAELEKEAKLVENQRDIIVAESDSKREVAKAEYDRAVNIARLEATATAEKRKYEVQTDVEKFRNEQEIAKLRASDLSLANVKAEVKIKEADGVAAARIVAAEAEAKYKIIVADAEAKAIESIAKANLSAKENEAKGIQAIEIAKANGLKALKDAEAAGILAARKAEAEGLQELVKSAGGAESLNKYLIVREEHLPKIVMNNAKAFKDMSPNVTIWQTGSNEKQSSLTNMMSDFVSTGVPLFEGLKQQTGYDILGQFLKKDEKDQTKNKSSTPITKTNSNESELPVSVMKTE